MANPDKPRGLVPVKGRNGASWDVALAVPCLPDDTTESAHSNYYIGTPVTLSDVETEGFAEGFNHLPVVAPMIDEDDEVATVAQMCYGVVVGVGNTENATGDPQNYGMFDASDLTKRYVDSAEIEADETANVLWVALAKDWIYEIQTDAALTGAQVGEAVDINVADTSDITTGSTTTGLSNVEITAIEGGNFTIVAVPERVDNDPDLANADFHVVATNPYGGGAAPNMV